MAHYDWFAGHLECPHCHVISPDDASTEMHTYLRDTDDHNQASLRAGDAMGEIDTEEFQWSYRTVHEPDTEGEIRILQGWRCPRCGAGDNWAEIVIRRHTIESVAAISLDTEALERAHLIHAASTESLAAELSGRPITGFDGSVDLIKVLRPNFRIPDDRSRE
jgi:hypothetical protein